MPSTGFLEIRPKQVVEVYDGDTFKIDLQGVHPLFGDKLPIRVKGIDTPELRGTTEEVKALAEQARELTENTLKGAKKIELRNPERGKYFRIVAEVWVDGKALATMLKEKGLAKDYDGEGKDQSGKNSFSFPCKFLPRFKRTGLFAGLWPTIHKGKGR